MSHAPFRDTDERIRKAREIAYKFMHQTQLRNPTVALPYTTRKAPRPIPKSLNLHETLKLKFGLKPDDVEFQALWEGLRTREDEATTRDVLPKPYNPEKERRETENMERQEEQARIRRHLRRIFSAMCLLADQTKPELDPTMVREHILPLLETAPQFIASKLIPAASKEEIEARHILHHADDIARTIVDQSKGAFALTNGELKAAKNNARFVDEEAIVRSLALNDFLTAINEVNGSARGKKGHRL